MKKNTVLIIVLILILTGCQSKEIQWGYESENGPEKWAELSTDNKTCNGQSQSPINIDTNSVQKAESSKLTINYSNAKFKVIDTGHSIEFELLEGQKSQTVTYNGIEYALEQFHFHNKSENTIDQKYSPLEIHFVNKDKDGNPLVLSVLVNTGETNKTLKNYGTKIDEEVELNPFDIFPVEKQYYSFTGSLTTPPCTEGVQWVVMQNQITMSEEQINDYTQKYSENNRPIQPLNNREISINA